jgi:hypothetical protein
MSSPAIGPAQFNLTYPKVRPILTYRKDEPKVSFSRQIVSIIAANVLVVHVLVGCCAHHEHVQVNGTGLAIIEGDGHHDHHPSDACHHQSADPTAPSNGEQPCDHPCGESSCSFLAGSKIVMPDLAQPGGNLAAIPTLLLNQTLSGSLPSELLPDGVLLPPVRSHLSKCVLLV